MGVKWTDPDELIVVDSIHIGKNNCNKRDEGRMSLEMVFVQDYG